MGSPVSLAHTDLSGVYPTLHPVTTDTGPSVKKVMDGIHAKTQNKINVFNPNCGVVLKAGVIQRHPISKPDRAHKDWARRKPESQTTL